MRLEHASADCSLTVFPDHFGLHIVMIAKEELKVIDSDARMLSLNEFGFLG